MEQIYIENKKGGMNFDILKKVKYRGKNYEILASSGRPVQEFLILEVKHGEYLRVEDKL